MKTKHNVVDFYCGGCCCCQRFHIFETMMQVSIRGNLCIINFIVLLYLFSEYVKLKMYYINTIDMWAQAIHSHADVHSMSSICWRCRFIDSSLYTIYRCFLLMSLLLLFVDYCYSCFPNIWLYYSTVWSLI